jgi:TRAP-type mannitol/chloroaromatic compound transport system permease large subunit
MSAFYLKGVAPKHVTLGQIYRGMYPFMILQLIAMGVLWIFPELANWLPREIFGQSFR